MPAQFHPLPDDEPEIDLHQFLARLKTEPDFAAKMRAHYEAALAVPESPDTADMRAKAAAALSTLKHHQGVLNAQRLLTELLDLIGPDPSRFDSANLPAARAKLSDAMDHLLDVQEPKRTALMKSAVGIQELIDRITNRRSTSL